MILLTPEISFSSWLRGSENLSTRELSEVPVGSAANSEPREFRSISQPDYRWRNQQESFHRIEQDAVEIDFQGKRCSGTISMDTVPGHDPVISSGNQLTTGSQRGRSCGKEEAGPDATDVKGKIASTSGEVPSSSQPEATQLLSPGFRSAAALAGWDDEALMLAALNQSPAPAAVSPDASNNGAPCEVPYNPACRERKRDKHTPLSSARRHRRVRWIGNNGSPLVKVPMKALPHVSDSDKGENNVENDSTTKVDKENINPQPSATGKKTPESKGKPKAATPTKLPNLDQLREELSCAVCLEICFEPSTISCGHSFCGTCLQSVLKMCGPKCPKCRQPLRSEALRSCRTNTVLWNTIQILFPQECAARQAEKQKLRNQEEAASLVRPSSLGVRPSRLQPWRTSNSNLSSTANRISLNSVVSSSVNRISVMGTLRSSFQTAAEFLEDESEGEVTQRDNEVRPGSNRSSLSALQEVASQRSQSRSGRVRRARQEQVDAALAARLQHAELMMGSNADESVTGQTSQSRYWSNNRPRSGNSVTLAASNLRAVATRATRNRSRS
ncbi:hypothetical protein R1sor_001748 [Riccia sorocarpa]|uniref:RING-type E3 ubiquitin transferase n=1 Tax=Riccia sorocarpa TaxID=122646 RepID=A0ABD3H111_9MARC